MKVQMATLCNIPATLSKENYFSQVNKALDAYGSKFENIIMIGDINTTETDEKLVEFLEDHELSNLVLFPMVCYVGLLRRVVFLEL